MGNQNPGIGTEKVFKDVYELQGKNRARLYYREVDGKIKILAKSNKDNQILVFVEFNTFCIKQIRVFKWVWIIK